MMTNKKIGQMLGKAVRADMDENPSLIFLLSERTKKGKAATEEVFQLDILNMLKGQGPILFPHLQGAVKKLISEAKGTVYDETGYLGAEETKPATQPTGWLDILGVVIGAGAQIGSAIYTGRQQVELEKDKLELEQRIRAEQDAARAKELEAQLEITKMNLAQAALQEKAKPTTTTTGLPSWLLPVGIGAAVLIGVFMFSRG